jgi:hypothetical protein
LQFFDCFGVAPDFVGDGQDDFLIAMFEDEAWRQAAGFKLTVDVPLVPFGKPTAPQIPLSGSANACPPAFALLVAEPHCGVIGADSDSKFLFHLI